MERKDKILEIIVLALSFVALLAMNLLGEAFKFGGVTSADVSNEVFAWFAPAGYVFMIWSVIYIGLIVWLVRLIIDDSHDRRFAGMPLGLEPILFVISCVFNIVWLILWHLKIFPATIPVIILLLVSVVALYLTTRKRSESWLDRVPISLYASWLVVATVANIAHVATRNMTGDAGLVPAISTIALLAIFVVITFFVRRIFNDYAFGIVVAWAGIGVGVRLVSVSPIVGVLAILISTIGIAAALVPLDRFLATGHNEPVSRRRR